MATVTTLPAVRRQSVRSWAWSHPASRDAAFVLLCTAAAFLLLGYHPYAEDGGIYAAALAARMDPSLFPAEHAFAVAHTGRSLFVPLLALLASTFHLSLAWVLLGTYAAALAATVAAARAVANLLFSEATAQRWAVATLVISLGLPVAGTSLYLFDPYLSARSLSTPLLLWAFALLLQRRMGAVAGCLLVAFMLHPMMAASSAVLFGFTLALRSRRRMVWTVSMAAAVLMTMALLHVVPAADGQAVRAASISRSYWFPREWAWYEVFGLVAPLVLLPAIGHWRRLSEQVTPGGRRAADAAAIAVSVVAAGTLLFVHPADASMLLARLQPLRLLHTVYVVFLLLLGGLAGRLRALRTVRPAWAICAVGGMSLWCMQRTLYPHAPHLELPWHTHSAGYQGAFLWARDHTPKDALFALDANYTTAAGEDAQMFRAVALRSSLPDAAKDGGIASVMPQLAGEWQIAAQAQTDLATATDAQRVARVRQLGATWIVLPSGAATAFDCPYANETAKVCRLP